MAKALIFADLHVHNHKGQVDRLQNCVDVLDWVFQQAKINNCEYIFFLGDLFHERSKIDVLNYLRTFEVFMKHMIDDASQRQVFLLVGNHDMYHKERWDVSSVKPLSAIPNVHIIQSPLTKEIGGCRINWLPYTNNPLEHIAKFKQEMGDILLGHIAVHGALLNTSYGTRSDVVVEFDSDMIPVDANLFSEWKMVFLGHYHAAQKFNDKVEYVGSPLQLNFGESFQQKQIIVLDLRTLEKTYIFNDFSPKHLIVSPDDIENSAYDLNGNFIRIVVNDIGNKDLVDLKQKIIKENQVLTLDLKQRDKSAKDDTTIIDDIQSILHNTEEVIRRYVEENNTSLDKCLLMEVVKKCLKPISS